MKNLKDVIMIDKSSLQEQLTKMLESTEIDFQKFLELSSEFIKFDEKNLRFTTDAGTIAHLGRESIKDHTTAVLELVKNGYDADAFKVEIEIHINEQNSFIRIADSGTGMTKEEVINNWLRIGFSNKRIVTTTKKNRRKTGEKGIGRLSADRLGSSIKLITKSETDEVFGLNINWDDFNKQGIDLSLIPFGKIQDPIINLPKIDGKESETGTEIIISDLRNIWTDFDIKRLYEELSILTSPFKAIDDFKISISSNIESDFNGEIRVKEHIPSEVEISVYYDGESDNIIYSLNDKYGIANGEEKSIKWNLLSQRTKNKDNGYLRDIKDFGINENKPNCGPVIFNLMFYPRETALIKGTGFTLNQLKEYLSYNGGVKIYRDNISVKPYGFSGKDGEDWLNLGERQGQNPAGIGRDDWMVKNNQVIGAVYISRDENSNLTDSAAREGLVHNEGYYDLRALVLCGMRLLELHRHNIHKTFIPEPTFKVSSKKILLEYKEELENMKKELNELKKQAIENNHHYVLNATNSVNSVLAHTESTQKSLDEILNKNRTLGGLATIGIASAVFGHETQISISQFKMANEEAIIALNDEPPNINEALKELKSANSYSSQVSEWGTFALTRIKRDKRSRKKTDVKSLLTRTINEVVETFSARGIIIKTFFEEVEASTFPMDIETIVINLLTNSYSACLNNDTSRVIHISLKNKEENSKAGFELIVSDSGQGIDEQFRSIIWEALFSTKTDEEGNDSGTGLGLTIVQSILEDLEGLKHVENDSELKGAKFSIWLPKNN